MKRVGNALIYAVLSTLVALPAAGNEERRRPIAEDPGVATALTVLDAWISATMRKREQPGLSIGIVHDQELVWAQGYGYAGQEAKIPATPRTLYRIASISKLFTATAIMQLRDAGKLSLDDPVEKHLPWFRMRSISPQPTIRHLLTHTSGLPREALGLNWVGLKIPDRDQMIRGLANQQGHFAAGSDWKYSNLALTLAGEIVAAVSGRPWAEYIDNHVFKPLVMSHSRAVPRAGETGLAVGYTRRVPREARRSEPFVDIGSEAPAGSIASSVEDLARFVSLQFRDAPTGGTQILAGSTIGEMHRVQWLEPDWEGGYGIGFEVQRKGEKVRVGHGGALHGFRTLLMFVPADKIGVIVLTNAHDGAPGLYLDKAFDIVGPAIAQATATPVRRARTEPAWQAYVGRYENRFEEIEVLLTAEGLVLVDTDLDEPWDMRVKLEPASGGAFRAVPLKRHFVLNYETLTFQMGEDGRVDRLVGENIYWTRTGSSD